MDRCGNDVLQTIFDIAAASCSFPHERADLQRSIIFVNKQFCLVILGHPIVSLNDAFEIKDPLAANIALRYASGKPESVAKEQLLDCPHVVAAALRLRGRRPKTLRSPFDAYVHKLASVVVRDVGKAFSHYYIHGREVEGVSLKIIIERVLKGDEWKEVASVIVKRGTISTSVLVAAAHAAYGKGYTECLKLLAEYCSEFVCTPSFLGRARSMKRGCDYLTTCSVMNTDSP
jgi:hypothetical protein